MNPQANMQRVRDILLREWDPLGVGDNPNLAAEYDSDVAAIMHLLERQCDSDILNQHLAEVERELGVQQDSVLLRAIRLLTRFI